MPKETQNVGQRRSRIVLVKTLRSNMARVLPSALGASLGRTRDGVARPVVGHEYLLEACLDCPEVPDLEAGRGLDQSIQAALDGAAKQAIIDLEVADAGHAGKGLGLDRLGELDLQAAQGSLLQVRDRLHGQQPGLANDPDSVAEMLNFRQLVR